MLVLNNILVQPNSLKILTIMRLLPISTKNASISVLRTRMPRGKPKHIWVSVFVRKKCPIFSTPNQIQKRPLARPKKALSINLKKKSVKNSSEFIKQLPYSSKNKMTFRRPWNLSRNVLRPRKDQKIDLRRLSATKKLVTFMRDKAIQ